MQEKKMCEDQELICINVDKVYDWIVKENSFDFALPTGNIVFTPTVSVPTQGPGLVIAGATVTCEVAPAAMNPIVITDRQDRPFCINGKTVLLQQLNIRKNFVVTLIVTLANGTVLTSAPPTSTVNTSLAFSRCEQVTLCAPEGTTVSVTFTDLDCFVCSPGTLVVGTVHGVPAGSIEISGLTISIATCQSIQSTFPVTVEFLADFCEPREELPTACPAPMRPRQCPTIFPDEGHDHGHCCH
ncbi:MAG: hypothetical protein ABTA16_18110 [Niallia sp.]